MILALLSAAFADCPAAPAALSDTAADARAAFAKLDAERFSELVKDLEEHVDCLDATLTPQQAAEIHTVRALASFLEADEVSTGASLRAALAADPEVSLDWLPPLHPIHFELRYAERTLESSTLGLDPRSGVIVVDGVLVDEIIDERPAILQRQEGGAVVESALVPLAADLPGWAPRAPIPLSPEVKRRLWLGSATATTAIASGVMLGFSAQYRDNYLRNTDPALFAEWQRKTNITSASSIALAGMSAGFGSALVIAW